MMAKLRITSRGKAAGLIGASVIALGAATGDALVCAAGALVPLAMAADFVGMKARERGAAGAVVRMGAGAGAQRARRLLHDQPERGHVALHALSSEWVEASASTGDPKTR